MQVKLAFLYNRLDLFDQAITLLDRAPSAGFVTAHAMATALAGRGAAGDDERALSVAQAAHGLATTNQQRALALAHQARAWLRLGNLGQALALFKHALTADPHNAEVLAKLAGEYLARGEPDGVLALIGSLRAQGVAHSQILGCETLAQAQRGDFTAARAVIALDAHLHAETIEPPSGWATLAAFNAALVDEVMASPGLRNGRHGTASIDSLRVDEPAITATPAMRALQGLIARRVMAVVAHMPASGHRWIAQRPAQALLRMWCVITGANGRERWHMHPLGWATGHGNARCAGRRCLWFDPVPAAHSGRAARAGGLAGRAVGTGKDDAGVVAAAAGRVRRCRARATG
jgi:hypothetical protein